MKLIYADNEGTIPRIDAITALVGGGVSYDADDGKITYYDGQTPVSKAAIDAKLVISVGVLTAFSVIKITFDS